MWKLWALAMMSTLVMSRTTIVTIDDGLGDSRTGVRPVYVAQSEWHARSGPEDCPQPDCGAQPDGLQMLHGTWHDHETMPGESPANISFSFTGNTLRIFFALANNETIAGYIGSTVTRLAIYFDDDATAAFQFLHIPGVNPSDYKYKQAVVNTTTLSTGEHTVLISGWADGDSGSLMLFDFAEYEVDDPEPVNNVRGSPVDSPHSSTSTASSMSDSTSFTTTSASFDSVFSSPVQTSDTSASTSSASETSYPDNVVTNTPAASPSPTLKISWISAVATVGSLIFSGCICAAIFFWQRRRLRQLVEDSDSDSEATVESPIAVTPARREDQASTIRPLFLPPTETSTSATIKYRAPPSASINRTATAVDMYSELADLRAYVETLRATVDAPPPQYEPGPVRDVDDVV